MSEKRTLNDNTVAEKLTNAGADLEDAATALAEVLTALAAIMRACQALHRSRLRTTKSRKPRGA